MTTMLSSDVIFIVSLQIPSPQIKIRQWVQISRQWVQISWGAGAYPTQGRIQGGVKIASYAILLLYTLFMHFVYFTVYMIMRLVGVQQIHGIEVLCNHCIYI